MKIIDGQEYVLMKDAALYVDVTCWKCKRTIALSNAKVVNGRYLCERCDKTIYGSLEDLLNASKNLTVG